MRWWHDPKCDSCQVALARVNVDSVRTLNYDPNNTGAFALFMTPILVIAGFAYKFSTIRD